MKLIKLDAIDSTNTFLKELAQVELLDNFTVVTASEQLKGRGQMNTGWLSEPNKNLLCSVFYKFENALFSHQVYLNYAISLSVYQTLQEYKLLDLAIKWPNDILSQKNKVSGILIESVVKQQKLKSAIIGIGLNVNQVDFFKDLYNVTSIKEATGNETNIDEVLRVLIQNLKKNIKQFEMRNFLDLEKRYLKTLYKKNIPTMFKTSKNVLFMGMIIGVSTSGKLQIQLEDDSVKEFGIKEVSFAN
ncbi:MAG: biotin--[acetyl-CoA-carboxylase] ligase [Flavobacteriaceae bacterium]